MSEKIYVEIRGGVLTSIKTTTSNIDIVVTDWDNEAIYPYAPDAVITPEEMKIVIESHSQEIY